MMKHNLVLRHALTVKACLKSRQPAEKRKLVLEDSILDLGTPKMSKPMRSSSTGMRGTTSPVVRTRKWPGRFLVMSSGSGDISVVETSNL